MDLKLKPITSKLKVDFTKHRSNTRVCYNMKLS